jgi:hypothetical protein
MSNSTCIKSETREDLRGLSPRLTVGTGTAADGGASPHSESPRRSQSPPYPAYLPCANCVRRRLVT